MADYSKWPVRDQKVTSLRLDAQNPRIPPTDTVMSQGELIAELVEHDDVYSLAKKIAVDGYYPDSTLIGVKEDKAICILEGNRRLAALKLLLNPELAPSNHATRFKRLSEQTAGKQITKIRVVEAPSRMDAAPLIMSRHTGTEIEKWTPIMQALFCESLVNKGLAPRDLAEQYGISLPEVMRFLRTSKLYRITRGLDLPDKARRMVDDPRSFPITNLTRLTENEEVQSFLGIRPDSKAILEFTIDPTESKKGLTKMVVDVANEVVTSRSHNTSKEISSYLKTFGEYQPNKQRKGHAAADEVIGASVDPSMGKRDAKAKAKKQISKSVLPPGCKCELNVPRINEVFAELKKLRISTYPNASAIMFRSLLEMGVSHYFDATGHTQALKAKLNKKGTSPRPASFHPSLDQMLKYVLAEQGIPLNPNARKALNKLVAGTNALTLESMNGFVHNRYTTPTESELRSISGMVQPLLELVLVEPPKKK